jgi:hypothetical protein
MLGFNRGRVFVCEGRKSAPAQPRLVAVFGFLSAVGEERFIARVVDGEDAGAIPPRSSLEIRGVAGFAWHVVDHFQRWTLDLSRPFQAIERAADRETRRHVRRARAAGVTIDRLNSAAVRIRGKREFPRWPCESALIDYWRDWLKLSLQRLNASDAWHIGFWPEE